MDAQYKIDQQMVNFVTYWNSLVAGWALAAEALAVSDGSLAS
jgi:hypothetical protein